MAAEPRSDDHVALRFAIARRARRNQLTAATAAEQLSGCAQAKTVAEVNEGVRRYAITVRLHPDERENVEHVATARVARNAGGAHSTL